MPIVSIPDCGKGVNKDLLPAELELGKWSGSTMNFRFRRGFAEAWEGVGALLTNGTMPTAPWFLNIYATATKRYAIYGGANGVAGVHSYEPATSTNTDITPYENAATVVTLTRDSATVARVTVAAPGHNLQTGDLITWFGATESGYNVASAAITFVSSTVFTYPVSAIASNATVVGNYAVITSVNTGDLAPPLPARVTGGALNGILLLNSPTYGLAYWAGNTAIRCRFLPRSYLADVSRPFKSYIIQLAPTIGGTKFPFDVAWSESAEPGALPVDFEAAADNDAGRVSLAETDGKLIDCLPLGDVNIIYKDDCYYTQQYIGGNDVFKFDRVPQSDGLMAPGCVVDTPKGHVFMTPDLDVKIHQGGAATSIVYGQVQQYLRSLAPSSGVDEVRKACFLCVHPRKNEVWVCVPTSTGVYGCQTVLAWNWVDNTWSEFDTTSQPLYSAATGLYPFGTELEELLIVGTWNGLNGVSSVHRLGDASNGDGSYFSSTMTKTLERTGLHLESRDRMKTFDRSRWNIDATAAATATISHGSAKFADTTPTYATGVTYTVGTTDYVNARATQGRFLAMKLTTTAYPLLVRSIDMDVKPGGTR